MKTPLHTPLKQILTAGLLWLGATAQGAMPAWLATPRHGAPSAPAPAVATVSEAAEAELAMLPGERPAKLRVDTALTSVTGPEGFRLVSAPDGALLIEAATPTGALYGVFAARRLGTANITDTIAERPAYGLRVLNHWDNLDGTIERGYAGRSLWQWDSLPAIVSPRYAEYARANASVGINTVVLNNVNASPRVLSAPYIAKVAALAATMRPYGIRVMLSVNFASPMALDSLPTADPLDPAVRQWWRDKADEIYAAIPDFGGFLVKANSEGQPGPMDFGRTHADGANMLADALRSHGGKVMWRAFVYSPSDADRAKQAYLEFDPLDGRFAPEVIVQIKNGPVDFQPREPYSPLFGAMPQTAEAVEFQVTQEYLGHANHLAFLAPMWEEFFSYVEPGSLTAVAGVANIGDEANYTGHPLAEANWYALGRLAWDPSLSSRRIAGEWVDAALIDPATTPGNVRDNLIEMLLGSREAVVDYMMPLGLHHIFAFGHHYGPEPWCERDGARPDWLPSYYHRADSAGIGFDRTAATGSGATTQYPEPLRSRLERRETCPEELLLWFHHVPWTHRMKSGRTLWEELGASYQRGLDTVRGYRDRWDEARPWIDPEVWADVERRLAVQERDAEWWKDGCLLYFATFAGLPWPSTAEPAVYSLDALREVRLPIDNYTNPSHEMLNTALGREPRRR